MQLGIIEANPTKEMRTEKRSADSVRVNDVAQIGNLLRLNVETAVGIFQALAFPRAVDCQSATRQIANLRYIRPTVGAMKMDRAV